MSPSISKTPAARLELTNEEVCQLEKATREAAGVASSRSEPCSPCQDRGLQDNTAMDCHGHRDSKTTNEIMEVLQRCHNYLRAPKAADRKAEVETLRHRLQLLQRKASQRKKVAIEALQVPNTVPYCLIRYRTSYYPLVPHSIP